MRYGLPAFLNYAAAWVLATIFALLAFRLILPRDPARELARLRATVRDEALALLRGGHARPEAWQQRQQHRVAQLGALLKSRPALLSEALAQSLAAMHLGREVLRIRRALRRRELPDGAQHVAMQGLERLARQPVRPRARRSTRNARRGCWSAMPTRRPAARAGAEGHGRVRRHPCAGARACRVLRRRITTGARGMLSEFAVAGIYVPPLFVYVVAAAPAGWCARCWRAAACPAACGIRRCSRSPCRRHWRRRCFSMSDPKMIVMPLMLKKSLRILLTLAVVAAAGVLVAALWNAYVLAPWTRTGASAHSVRIAPEVSGAVAEVAVDDNQRVRRGDVLYRIDPRRFELAVEQARAHLVVAEETLRQRAEEARRRAGLDDIVPQEDIRRAGRTVAIAQAELRGARAALASAELDLERSVLRAGRRLHHPFAPAPGRHAVAGKPDVTILDGGSFWITGYFEETKLRRIQPGAPARIRLMGFESPLTGRVASIAAASPTKTTAWAITACRRSIRVSAGCGWRSGFPCASRSSRCPRACCSPPA